MWYHDTYIRRCTSLTACYCHTTPPTKSPLGAACSDGSSEEADQRGGYCTQHASSNEGPLSLFIATRPPAVAALSSRAPAAEKSFESTFRDVSDVFVRSAQATAVTPASPIEFARRFSDCTAPPPHAHVSTLPHGAGARTQPRPRACARTHLQQCRPAKCVRERGCAAVANGARVQVQVHDLHTCAVDR
jgi:hypothetical protein